MSATAPQTAAIAALIQEYEPNITNRSKRVASTELSRWTIEEVKGVMDQLVARTNRSGSDEPCGPEFNHINKSLKSNLLMQLGIWSIIGFGTIFLLPVQVGAAIYLLLHGRVSPIWREIPKPTALLFDWSTGLHAFVKAPMSLIKKAIEREEALCVNRKGKFMLRKDNYAVLSHVWGETMGWMTKDSWGPVELDLRKRGIAYYHFQKFFRRCDAKWLWVDVLAMPEVYEDMSPTEKAHTEALRTGVINNLRTIYTQADKIVCLDSLLLRLRSGSMVDVAVTISLGRWIARLWTFTETKLAKRVILKTEDATFDLDEIIAFFYETINNEDHRYFHMFARLAPLRPVPSGFRCWLGYLCRPDSYEPELFKEIYWGCENRLSEVKIDQARALFPVLELKWVPGWTLQQGLQHMAGVYPGDKDSLLRYCDYRGIHHGLQ
ncbi:MAG: hypothetical protein L6R39_007352 [Caloplaca ligustica]|nr:MAG: hypothetical protein L6R39_007352 [Caloplaca ligustica]